MQTIRIEEDQAGQRLDSFLAQINPKYSRSIWKKLISSGHVVVNGGHKDGKYLLHIDDILEIKQPETPKQLDLPIIYQDDNVIVINKPAGVLTHLKSSIESEATVASFVAPYTNASGGNRAGIVHRLDRATSGVMVAAKNDKARVYLAKQFANRRVEKWYLAVVSGIIEQDNITVDEPLSRSYSKPNTFKVNLNGKEAKTEVFLLGTQDTHSVVLLKPFTGRTHQLRVHLKHIGHPIIGDPLYSNKYSVDKTPDLLLHAWQLTTTLPDNERPTFVAELPQHMTQYVLDEHRDKAQAIITPQ